MLRRSVLGLVLAFAVQASAWAQWQVPSGSIPVGRGPGVTGFNTVGGSAGGGTKCLLDTAPPTFGACPGAATSPGGVNGNVQFNNAGNFGGLTDTQLTARIAAFTSGLSGAVPASGGGTSNFLRADGTFAAPSTSVTIGSTPVLSGPSLGILYNNAGTLGSFVGQINAKQLSIKQDGISLTATVSITSGTKTLTATGATFTAADVGKQIMIQGAGPTATMTISSGTYNSGTGVVTLTLSAPLPNNSVGYGANIVVSGLTGTGAFASLNGSFVAQFGTLATTIVYNATSGLGATTITGGSVAQSAYLTSSITVFTDATHVTINDNAGTTVSAAAKNVTYCTDDFTAITNAVTSVLSNGQTLVFTDGIVCHSGSINWAFNNLHVAFTGDNTTFIHTGSGIAHSFNGFANLGGQGAVGGSFGGPGRPMLRGNPNGNTTVAVKFDNWHFGTFKAAARDATTVFQCRDSGIVGSSAVDTIFDWRASNNTDGAYIIQPNSGVDCTKPVGSLFERMIIEGTGAGSNKAVILTGAVNNMFRGGTVESNSAGGIIVDNTSSRNSYWNIDSETNGIAADWTMASTGDVMTQCANGGTTAGAVFNTISLQLIGGSYTSLTNNDATLYSVATKFNTAFTNNAPNSTTILIPYGAAAPGAIDNSATAFGNKNINTANANTIRFNSKTVNDLAGAGPVIAATDIQNTYFTKANGVNFNSIADTALVLTMPSGYTRVQIFRAFVDHCSATTTTAVFTINTATGGGGSGMIPSTTSTVSSAADITINNFMSVNGSNITAIAASLPTPNTLQFRITTPQGSAVTCDVSITYFVFP